MLNEAKQFLASNITSLDPAHTASLLGAVQWFRANKSFRKHPLGFVYAKEPLVDGSKIRIHYWPYTEHQNQGEFEFHDHSFHLRSAVLAGEIVNINCQAVASDKPKWAEFQTTYQEGRSTIKHTGMHRDLQVIDVGIHDQGTCYSVPKGVVHRAISTTKPTLTAVLETSIEETAAPRVYSRAETVDRRAFDRDIAEDAVLRELDHTLNQLLQSRPTASG